MKMRNNSKTKHVEYIYIYIYITVKRYIGQSGEKNKTILKNR